MHRPVLYVLAGLGVFDALDGTLGNKIGRVVWVGCALLCVVLFSAEIFELPFKVLFRVLADILQIIRKGDLDYQYKQFVKYWNAFSKRKKALLYIGAYTIAFLAAFLIAYSPYLTEKTTFVWNSDGRLQHFPILVYIGRFLRHALQNALNGDFSIPLFDLNMNMGDNIFGFINPMGGTDPLALLSAFVPTQYSEYLYGFLAIFRVYLAGLSFSALCFYFNKLYSHTLIGSIVYCFSGFALVGAMRHPFWISAMCILPLLIVGADKVLKRERPYLFIISVFFAALNIGYYHLYMMTIMFGVYVLVRFFDIYKEKRLIVFCHVALRGILYYTLGIGLSAVIFFPSVLAFLSSGRSGYLNYNPSSYT